MRRRPLLWFPVVALMIGSAPLSCGESGGSPTAGTLDTSFGAAGKVTTTLGTFDDQPFALAIQPNRKLVAAGFSNTSGPQPEFALVRYNTDGSLDTTFNTTGIVTTDIGTFTDVAFALAIQPNGRLVAAGSSNTGTKIEFALVRYWP